MSQALDVLTIISELSNALAKLGTRVDMRDSDPDDDDDDNDGAEKASKSKQKKKKKKSSSVAEMARKSQHRNNQRERVVEAASREMASVAHDLNARLEVQALPDWVDGTSVATLTALTASNQRLMSLTKTHPYPNGISARKYCQLSVAAHELIRDVSDYGRAVIVSQIEQVRAQNFTGDMAVDMRPAKASVDAATHGSGGAYNIADDDAKPAGATAFHESEMSLLGGDLSAYQTPSTSAAVTPVSSRPPSPPLSDDEPDLMGVGTN